MITDNELLNLLGDYGDLSEEDTALWLECPKCGEDNQETEFEELTFICSRCRCHYDWAVCPECEGVYGTYFGQDDTCPLCGANTNQ